MNVRGIKRHYMKNLWHAHLRHILSFARIYLELEVNF